MQNVVALAGLLSALCAAKAGVGGEPRYDEAFKTAVAVWHMDGAQDGSGRHPLDASGQVTVGVPLAGRERQESLRAGSDGMVADFKGGYLNAGQGTAGALNLSGGALTVAARLRSPSGVWGGPLFSKHGGHDQLVYNLFSFPNAIGFELGVQGAAGMTQVLAPVARIGADAWHTVICRYDGRLLRLYVDGVVMDEAAVSGELRIGNTVPVVIGGESIGGAIHSGWSGRMDYVALWNRALTDAEVVRLSGGETAVAHKRKLYGTGHVLPAPADLYHETYRPQFHFTARQWTVRTKNPGQQEEGWLNDPNGLVYVNGEYHLFAQRWAKCWIHAVSRDLIHWTELQPAFWADSRFGRGCQSGGAVYDRHNTSGLVRDARHPAIVAFWPGFDNVSQCISYSVDDGRTWTKYAGNPVLLHPERDPKVIWDAPRKQWMMVLSDNGSYDFFRSPDLLRWTQLPARIPNSFECPDLFELPLDGDTGRSKWVLVRGDGKYSVGHIDEAGFVEETPQLPGDQGPNFYATMSWGEIPGAPGRRIQIAWMRGGQYPDMPFNQQMSFPCDLTLHSTPGGPRVYRAPAPEIAQLHGKVLEWKAITLRAGETLPLSNAGDLFHLVAEVEVPDGAALALRLRGATVALTSGTVACGTAPIKTAVPVRKVEVLLDRCSVETFANDGEVSLSACFLPKDDRLALECTGGAAVVRSLRLYPLRSIWTGRK